MYRYWPVLLLVPTLFGQARLEQPVGLILSADGARLRRTGSDLPLTAMAGDILFNGDSVLSETASVIFLSCPERAEYTLQAPGEVILREDSVRIRSGRFSSRRSVENCLLPKLDRVPATQQHYGGSLIGALRTSEEAIPTPSGLDALPEEQRAEVKRELEPLDRALSEPSIDPSIRVARATIFEKYHLSGGALEEYKKLAEAWPEAAWLRSRIFVHEKEIARSSPRQAPEPRTGRTYALVVGISKYQRLPDRQWLQDAHQDALSFGEYLASPRGGALPPSDIVLLTDEKATTAAVKNGFETFLKARAGADDTVVVYIAAHGVVEPGRRGAYIVTYDSDPEDLGSTGLPMAYLQTLIREDLSRVGHVFVYIDVCRAGNIGAMKGGNQVNKAVEQLAEADGDLFLFLASGPKEYSYEGPQYGGGHGAFSYFLLDGMNGTADFNRDGIVTVGEIIEYVRERVIEATVGKQHPRDLGSMEHAVTLAEMRLSGITLARYTGLRNQAGAVAAGSTATRGLGSSGSTGTTETANIIDELDRAIASGRILPDEPQGAFAALRLLRRQLTPAEYLVQENKLRIALEDAGQQVLLRYLRGDQVPQDRDDFLQGYAYFEAARQLTPESLFLESRSTFCNGRIAIFEKDYRRATSLLERAVRIDPDGAYSYNALGIAYLEQGDYVDATLAFRDATRLAPQWAYPLHNLALASTQIGDYNGAVRHYLEAMALAPQYFYLPYNLGLVYQRLNRRHEAEAEFRRAIVLAPGAGEPYNALGYLYASYGKTTQAERLYRDALGRAPDLLAARQNLAVLLAVKTERFSEAVDLWRQNLAKSSDYMPSRLSLARALARRNQNAEAIEEYTQIVMRKPEYIAARLALAELEVKQGNGEAALVQLEEAVKLQPENPAILEQIGDLQKSLGRSAEAAAAYHLALQFAEDRAARKRIRGKIK